MITLRELTSDDWRVWRQVRLAALAEAPYAFGSRLADWQGDGDREQRWRSRLETPGSYHVVAERDGEPVGMAAGIPAATAEAVELVSMWVSPQARGRGVSDRLIEAVARWAQRRGATVLRLAVAQGNEPARAAYRRHGFRFTGEPAKLMPDGVRKEDTMVKDLR